MMMIGPMKVARITQKEVDGEFLSACCRRSNRGGCGGSFDCGGVVRWPAVVEVAGWSAAAVKKEKRE